MVDARQRSRCVQHTHTLRGVVRKTNDEARVRAAQTTALFGACRLRKGARNATHDDTTTDSRKAVSRKIVRTNLIDYPSSESRPSSVSLLPAGRRALIFASSALAVSPPGGTAAARSLLAVMVATQWSGTPTLYR
eukprot:GHVU01091707.1.p2 GENE.GHVU01091707.1~~GHVU01091707.1.p2  ORF type:complete len:135 (+),score=12.80 GHVU01091707.1:1109-1513(+)